MYTFQIILILKTLRTENQYSLYKVILNNPFIIIASRIHLSNDISHLLVMGSTGYRLLLTLDNLLNIWDHQHNIFEFTYILNGIFNRSSTISVLETQPKKDYSQRKYFIFYKYDEISRVKNLNLYRSSDKKAIGYHSKTHIF